MKNMKKLLVALCLTSVLAFAAQAQDAASKPKHTQTPEQKAVIKAILEKYDTNKDGKLSREERSNISAEDKAKMQKVGLGRPHKPAAAPEVPAAPAPVK